MFRRIACASIVLVGATFANSVSAREFADIYTECGLGAMIAPRNTAVAAVTNVTWDSGTTAISSNSSSPDTCKGGQAKAAAMIIESYPSLEKELSQGEGEHVRSLVSLAHCSTADADLAIGKMRSDLAASMKAGDYATRDRYQKAEAMYSSLVTASSTAGAQSCSL